VRFILGFIFFGLLFYGLSIYLPDAFHTLVGWAAKIFSFFQELFVKISGGASETKTVEKSATSLFQLFFF
jgi:hypothetical protein